MLIRLALISSTLLAAFGASTAAAAPAGQPALSITDKHLRASVGDQSVAIGIFTAVPVTNVLVSCDVSSRDAGSTTPFSTLLDPPPIGASTFTLPWFFTQRDKTLASCTFVYVDGTTGLPATTGPFDVVISTTN